MRSRDSIGAGMRDMARGALEGFITHGAPVPDSETLKRNHLAPRVYTRSAEGDSARNVHRTAFLAATARHLANTAAFAPLLRAWCSAGIDVIIFKGFYLAEFVYDQPATRYYNDVDVIMRPELWSTAEEVARTLGWTILWERRSSLYASSHEEAVLQQGRTVVEVHRFAIDCVSGIDTVQRRVTEAGWERSREVSWQGATFRALAPEDSALLGLVLARAWSGGDDWFLKTADYLDLQAMSLRLGLKREGLERRAAELGCSRSLDLFLERCDPWRDRLSLRRPTALERQRWYITATPERGHLGIERALASLLRLPGTIVDIVRHLPHLIRTDRTLRTTDAPPDGEQVLPRHGSVGAIRTKERIVRGIKWGAYLLKFGRDPCLLRSYALLHALRAQGLAARVIEGRKTGTRGEQRHAWIEVPGLSMRDLEDVRACRIDKVMELDLNTESAARQRFQSAPGKDI